MRKLNKIALLVLIFLIETTVSVAQIDTSFWFAAPWVTPDHTDRRPIRLHLAGNPGAIIRLRQPGAIAPNKYDTTIILSATGFFDYTFWRDAQANATNIGYDSLECKPANTVVPYGLYISVTNGKKITAVYDVVSAGANPLNPETFSLKGQNAFGKEFVCPFQTRWYSVNALGDVNGDAVVTYPFQQINIVATKANTTVWIKPKTGVVGHVANVTYSVLLNNPGDCYTVQNLNWNVNVAGKNLSGTIVVSDKDIAVTVSDDSAHGLTGCYDLMGDQIVPVDIVGTDYVVLKGKMTTPAEGEGAFIVATENFTKITIDGVPSQTVLLNKGDTYHYIQLNGVTYVNADKNVYVLHGTGFGCELGEALLPPLNCAGSDSVLFTRNNTQAYFLNILSPAAGINSFTLSNSTATTVIPAANFTLVPGTAALQGGPYYGAQIQFALGQIPVNTPNLLRNPGVFFALGIYNGGVATGNMYHYMSSFLRRTTVVAQTLTPVCAGQNVTVALTGTVSGGAITGTWTSANGTGTYGAYTSTLNTVSTVYTLSNADTNATTIKFYLSSIGNCTPKKDSVLLKINQRPQVTILSTPTMQCKNNITAINLNGLVFNALSGSWTGGNGGSFGPPGINTTYTPSLADLAAGTITLTLSSQGPSVGCNNSSKSFTIGFVDPPTVSLPSTTIACTNSQSISLTGTVTGSNLSFLWTTNGTGFFNPSTSLTTSYFFSAGDLSLPNITVTFSVIDNSGLCANVSDQMQINILAKPTLTLFTPPYVCLTSSVVPLTGTVSGGGATNITWGTTNGTGAFNPVPPTNSNYQLGAGDGVSGFITFYANTNGGFCPTVADTVTVQVISPLLITTNPSTTVCEYTPIQLTGTVTGYVNTGFWATGGGGAFSPTNTVLNPIYYPSPGDLASGVVTFSLYGTPVGSITCFSAPTTFIATFVKSPKADFTFSSKRCIGDPVQFINTSSPNSTTITAATWDFGNGIGSISIPSAQATYTGAGIYLINFTVTGTNSLNITCTDTISKKISVNPLPIPDFKSNGSCVGLLTTFQNLSLPANGQFNWFFGPTGLPSVSTASAPNVVFSVNGPITVQLKETIAATQCTAGVIKTVNVNPKPNAEFGMTNNPTVAQEPVYYSDFSTPTGAIASWIWNFGDEASSGQQNPSHSYQNGGVFYVTLTVVDSVGCSDTTTKRIEVNLIPQVPSGFTPNGDGHNDRLFVKGGPFKGMIFRVYNNWGEKIYESADQNDGWDGKKDGKEQPVGVYVWTLEVDLYNNRTVKKNGDVTLLR